MKQLVPLVLFCSIISVAVDGYAADRSYVDPGTLDGNGLPFSGAVQTGETLYVAGHIGVTEDRKVPEDAGDEARLLMDQFQATVTKAGYTMDDLVSVTVYCSDVAHYAAFNAVYKEYFKQTFPARAFIGSGALLFNARFEMQGIAVKRGN